MKEAERLRVEELVKKIENHPHREALQADLHAEYRLEPMQQQCEGDDPRIGQCRVVQVCAKLYLKYNVLTVFLKRFKDFLYCTCGQLLVDSETRGKFHKLRLDALSIPNYVIKKGRSHGARHGKTEEQKEYQIAWNAWKRCCKKVDSQCGHFAGISL